MMMRILPVILTAVLALTATAVSAQKKSDEGKPNIWAATPMKIDGKINDWGDSLKIYNDGARLWFNIANDANNLYFAVKCNDSAELARLVAGGISFSANAEGKKKAGPTVTFPVLDRSAMRAQYQQRQQGGGQQQPGAQRGNMAEMRKNMISQMKEIKVSGFKDIVDGSISIYNTYGIKAAAGFNEKNQFICEVAVPLALMGLTTAQAEPVSFNIKVNGLEMPANTGGGPGFGGDRGFGGGGPGNWGGGRPGGMDMSRMFASSEIWIKQTMAKQ